jgi:hypothetical protein
LEVGQFSMENPGQIRVEINTLTTRSLVIAADSSRVSEPSRPHLETAHAPLRGSETV